MRPVTQEAISVDFDAQIEEDTNLGYKTSGAALLGQNPVPEEKNSGAVLGPKPPVR